MKIKDKLKTLNQIFIDTAPIIYYVEKNPSYFSLVEPVFEAVDLGQITAVTSPITLAESLIFPVRLNQSQLIQGFRDLIVNGSHTSFVEINETIGMKATELRVKYNLSLMDALQIATALTASCDSFLTNDLQLKRVTELDIFVLQEYSV